MQTTIPAVGGDFEGQTAGFGLQRFPLRCGEPWGHNGDLPGFYSLAFTSSNGRHQSILVTNADAATLPDAGRKAYLNALIGGFCGGRPALPPLLLLPPRGVDARRGAPPRRRPARAER